MNRGLTPGTPTDPQNKTAVDLFKGVAFRTPSMGCGWYLRSNVVNRAELQYLTRPVDRCGTGNKQPYFSSPGQPF